MSKRRRVLLVVVAVVLAVAGASLLWMNRRDKVGLSQVATDTGWELRFHFNRPITCVSVTVETPRIHPHRVPCSSRPGTSEIASAEVAYAHLWGQRKLVVEYLVGERRRHVSLPFDPARATVDDVKRMMNGSTNGQWVHARYTGRGRVLYFTTPVLWLAFGLREIRFGLDGGPLDQRVRFAKRDRFEIRDDDEQVRPIPETARSVTVEIVYLDGTTEARTFPMPTRGRSR